MAGRTHAEEAQLAKFYGDERVLKNSQHEAFAIGIVEGLIPVEAWRRACNKPSDASGHGTPTKWMRRPEIQHRITQIKKRIAHRVENLSVVTKEMLIERQLEVLDRCMQRKPAEYDEDGETVQWKFDSSGANKALHQLAQFTGAYIKSAENPDTEDRKTLAELQEEYERLSATGSPGEEDRSPEGDSVPTARGVSTLQ